MSSQEYGREQRDLDEREPRGSDVSGSKQALKDQKRKEDTSVEDHGDVDVLTQAAQGMAYAYHQASDYVSKTDRTEGQCAVQ